MNNINKQVTPDPHYSYEAFDLSARQVFNVNVGELIPVCCREVVPNDKFSVKVSDFVRALPMVTSPFVRAKQHLDFYFVPYSQLWSNWNQFISQRTQSFSSNFKSADFLPHFSLETLYDDLRNGTTMGTGQQDIVGRDYRRGALRLLHMLGYSYSPIDPTVSQTPVGTANPFRLAAYNKIWYDFYRQQQYDDGKHLCSQSPNANQWSIPFDIFNYDYLPCDTEYNANITNLKSGSTVEQTAHYVSFLASCQMRYRTWKKDLFTGLLPNTQFGAVSAINLASVTSSDVNRWVGGNSDFSPSNRMVRTRSGSSNTLNATNSLTDTGIAEQISHTHAIPDNSLDIFALRKAYALQKWRERALRAGNRVDNNIQAHYGSRPHYHNDWHPDYLGSVSGNLSIGDVDATAQTQTSSDTPVENGTLGNVAGKAIMSFDGHAFNFENAGDFGIIMGIYSILPESEYNATGIDRGNQLLEREDFFVEEYQNLGYEAVTSATYDSRKIRGVSPEPTIPRIVGYAPRYWNYKTEVDKVYGEFMYSVLRGTSIHPVIDLGAFSHWVTPRSQHQLFVNYNSSSGAVYIPLRWFYVDPRTFDTVFNASVDPLTLTEPDNFQFLVSLFMDCKAYRTMSVIGLPEL